MSRDKAIAVISAKTDHSPSFRKWTSTGESVPLAWVGVCRKNLFNSKSNTSSDSNAPRLRGKELLLLLVFPEGSFWSIANSFTAAINLLMTCRSRETRSCLVCFNFPKAFTLHVYCHIHLQAFDIHISGSWKWSTCLLSSSVYCLLFSFPGSNVCLATINTEAYLRVKFSDWLPWSWQLNFSSLTETNLKMRFVVPANSRSESDHESFLHGHCPPALGLIALNLPNWLQSVWRTELAGRVEERAAAREAYQK